MAGGPHPGADEFIGKNIVNAEINDDKLLLEFEDGVIISISDEGQMCCEDRYMRTDDDIKSLLGNKLSRVDVVSARLDPDDDTHEICFLEIGTDIGFVTIANHNSHNGSYGGFGIDISKIYHRELVDMVNNLRHIANPEVGDYWYEKNVPNRVVLQVTSSAVTYCDRRKTDGKGNWAWDFSGTKTVSRDEFGRDLFYGSRMLKDKTYCDVVTGVQGTEVENGNSGTST